MRLITGWLAGKDWTVIPTSRRVVALTFDAGANADAVPSVLAILRREGVAATCFLTGAPAAARSIAAAGFRIGNHTVSHPYLTRLSDAAVRQEVLGGAQQITAVTGKTPAPLFLFPFGDADARTIAIANQAGYVPVRWTVDRHLPIAGRHHGHGTACSLSQPWDGRRGEHTTGVASRSRPAPRVLSPRSS
jgi:peptidoglycan/xylan/chitin deacetylase (PgdA/CDA1 family)